MEQPLTEYEIITACDDLIPSRNVYFTSLSLAFTGIAILYVGYQFLIDTTYIGINNMALTDWLLAIGATIAFIVLSLLTFDYFIGESYAYIQNHNRAMIVCRNSLTTLDATTNALQTLITENEELQTLRTENDELQEMLNVIQNDFGCDDAELFRNHINDGTVSAHIRRLRNAL